MATSFHKNYGWKELSHIVHANINHHDTCVLETQSSRRAKDYNAIFSALKRETKIHGLVLKPEWFMVDFEIAVIKLFKKYFRAAIIRDG